MSKRFLYGFSRKVVRRRNNKYCIISHGGTNKLNNKETAVLEGEKVILKIIEKEDIPILWQLIYGTENPEWKKWDAPYFPLERIDYKTYEENLLQRMETGIDDRMLIIADNQIIGIVSYYWEHKPSNWLETGIVIYSRTYWNGGYGTEALEMWTNHLFESLPIPRVGLTTWSGNKRMMKVGEKLGMKLEGRMRKCRFYNGEYYDSIRMGVLREEWYGKRRISYNN